MKKGMEVYMDRDIEVNGIDLMVGTVLLSKGGNKFEIIDPVGLQADVLTHNIIKLPKSYIENFIYSK